MILIQNPLRLIVLKDGNYFNTVESKRPAPVNVHKLRDTVTMDGGKDRRRGFGPRTPHSSCIQGWATQNSDSEQLRLDKLRERG